MKIKRLTIWTLFCIWLLCGCGQGPSPTAEPVTAAAVSVETAMEEPPSIETTVLPRESTSLSPELAAFDQVFCGTRAITRSASRESIMLSKISLFFSVEEFPWMVVQVAVLDLDGDGDLEAVLEVENNMGYVILEYQNGSVLGTEIWYRAFQDLKADGSYRGSGSSFDCYYWQYGADGPILLAARYETETGSPYYSLSGEEASGEDFGIFEETQRQKENAPWYPSWEAYLAANK